MKYKTLCVVWVVAASPTWAATRQAADVCGQSTGPPMDSTQASVRCCNLEGGCMQPAICPGSTISFEVAQTACHDVGARVCVHDELSLCCGKGCGYDSWANWFEPHYAADVCPSSTSGVSVGNAALRCCGDAGTCTDKNLTGCFGAMTDFYGGQRACEAEGLRMCTLEELTSNCCGGSCGFDAVPVWYDQCAPGPCANG
ncbi:hypothetical protein DIPPA_57722, partial [Diplonema papillatum]